MLKKIKPRSFADYLALISFTGFLIIFLNSITSLDLSPYLTSVFLVLSGVGLMRTGRITTINQWSKDGIQGQEFAWLFTSIFGMFSVVVGILSLPQIDLITPPLKGIIAVSALFSMAFIFYQYISKD